MRKKTIHLLSILIVLLAACKTSEGATYTDADARRNSTNTDYSSAFRSVSNSKPNNTEYREEADSEIAIRKSIYKYVKKRLNVEFDNKLDRIPGKFRHTEMYQNELKKAKDRKEKHKKDLQRYHKELDSLASKYRQHEERTPSGVWKLTIFYGSFGLNAEKDATKSWDMYIANIEDWIDRFPASPTPRIVLAMTLIERAWAYRGSMLAKDVNPENWKPFRYYISQARDYLEETKSISSSDPHWYVVMSTIAKAQGWPLVEFLKLMDEGTTRHPYYYQTYFNGLNYLLPKWHGSIEEIELFAKAAVEKTKAKEKMSMYARIYWYASQVQYKHRLFTESKVVWKNMRQGIFDVLEQYPDQWNINNFAYFACFAKDQETTKKLTDRVQTPIQVVWEEVEVFDVCRNWANGQDPSLLDMIMPNK